MEPLGNSIDNEASSQPRSIPFDSTQQFPIDPLEDQFKLPFNIRCLLNKSPFNPITGEFELQQTLPTQEQYPDPVYVEPLDSDSSKITNITLPDDNKAKPHDEKATNQSQKEEDDEPKPIVIEGRSKRKLKKTQIARLAIPPMLIQPGYPIPVAAYPIPQPPPKPRQPSPKPHPMRTKKPATHLLISSSVNTQEPPKGSKAKTQKSPPPPPPQPTKKQIIPSLTEIPIKTVPFGKPIRGDPDTQDNTDLYINNPFIIQIKKK